MSSSVIRRQDDQAVAGAAPRAGRPVLLWAAFGVAVVLLQLYVYSSWMLSDDFAPVPLGPDPIPESIKVRAWITQGGCVIAAAAVAFWLVRGCVRARRLTFDAMLSIGFLSIFWLDPVPNLLRPVVMFNAYYVNRGSWVEHIPGWISPNGAKLPDSLLLELMAYVIVVAVAIGVSRLIGFTRGRWPRGGRLGALVVALLAMVVFVFAFEELVMIKSGWLAWSGVIHAVSVFDGTPYQFPFTEGFIFGATLTAMAALHHFRDDRGRSFVQRGLDGLPVPPRVRTAVSVFAVIGFANLAMILYNVATISLSLYIDQTPTFYPSYMNQLCDGTTGVRCPGPTVPIVLPAGR